MNDLDKQDLLKLAHIIKSYVIEIEDMQNMQKMQDKEKIQSILENITGCANFIIEIVENKPCKIEKMF